MSLSSVRRTLVTRLDEDGKGDRGWWVLTRVHVSSHWLKAIAEYLEHRSSGSRFTLNERDYRRLGAIIESQASDPGQQLRRHHLLVMDKPLQLLERLSGNRWAELALTEKGRELAYADDIGRVLESSLARIRFAKAPWSPTGRVREYSTFDVPVYFAAMRVLRRTGGYIDRDEFDFFLSRVRRLDEVNWAVNAIGEYRELAAIERAKLRAEVRRRIATPKAYQNWRDMGLHTFSLFSLGTSMVRSGNQLILTERWASPEVPSDSRAVREPGTQPTARRLRLPEPPEADDLLAPPAAPAINDGSDAESFVAKVLRSHGWTVAFYTNRRGYGFDLWARKEGKAMLVEVKSSVAEHGAVTLTRMEYSAAKTHGKNFVLAVVENMGSAFPRLKMIQDPANAMTITEHETIAFRIPRTEWVRAASKQAKAEAKLLAK